MSQKQVKGRIVGYVRLSREDTRAEGSLEEKFRVRAQIVRDLAIRHHLTLEESDIYFERESATTLAKRPVMSSLLEECRNGRIACLLSPYQDRVTRSSDHDRGDVKEALCAGKVVLITTEGEIDFGQDFGDRHELIYDIKAAVASHYVRDVIKKRKEADLVRLKEGTIGRVCAPYGFYRVKRADVLAGKYNAEQLGKFLPVPEEYAILEEILRRVPTEAVSSLIADLNRRQVPPPGASRPGKGSRQWHPSTLYALLTNPFYAGYLAQRKRVERGKGSVRLNPEDYVYSQTPGDWPQPMPMEDYLQRLQTLGSHPCASPRSGLLSGLLYCSHSHPMRLINATQYGCSCRLRGEAHPGEYLGQHRIERWVFEILELLISSLTQESVTAPRPRREERTRALKELAPLRRELAEKEAGMQDMILRESYFVGLLGRSVYEQTARKAAAQCEGLRNRVKALEEIAHTPDEAEALSLLTRLHQAGGLAALWERLESKQARTLIECVLKRLVVVEPEGRYIREVRADLWEWTQARLGQTPLPPLRLRYREQEKGSSDQSCA